MRLSETLGAIAATTALSLASCDSPKAIRVAEVTPSLAPSDNLAAHRKICDEIVQRMSEVYAGYNEKCPRIGGDGLAGLARPEACIKEQLVKIAELETALEEKDCK